MRYSVAMTGEFDQQLRKHLIRGDGQEDVIVATYGTSTGTDRTTAVLTSIIEPGRGDRLVHGNASFTSQYVARAGAIARARGDGLVLLHSHPGARRWQGLSGQDWETESDYERVALAFTNRALVGMTLSGRDGAWSARIWRSSDQPTWAESVRVVADRMTCTWNDDLVPEPRVMQSQVRTVSSWGAEAQASIARFRVLVVGGGSVGLDVAQRLAATGLMRVGVMDFDAVEEVNLDRLIGATRLDAALQRPKTEVAARLMQLSATARDFLPLRHDTSITDPDGLALALNYDVIFSCVDRPWPRAVLNSIAYADLIPVIDGGIALDTFPDGRLRSGIWRSHTLFPGRPCMVCLGQLNLGEVTLDQQGLLEDPVYIARSGRKAPASQNVAALSASVSAALLAQLVSLTAHPGGQGVPAALRYILAPHLLEHAPQKSGEFCSYESESLTADRRPQLARQQDGWRELVQARESRKTSLRLRLLSEFERRVTNAINGLK